MTANLHDMMGLDYFATITAAEYAARKYPINMLERAANERPETVFKLAAAYAHCNALAAKYVLPR